MSPPPFRPAAPRPHRDGASLGRRVAWLDVLRAIAIVLVMLHHYRGLPGTPAVLKWVALRGYLGVDIFFVLSGWLIGGQVFAEVAREGRLRLGRFWARRWLRTLPLYFVVLGVIAAGDPQVRARLVEHALFLQNYTSPHKWLVSWSLCIEEHFYLGLPLVVLLLLPVARRSAAAAIVGTLLLIALSPALRHLAHADIETVRYNTFLAKFYVVTHLRLDGLAIGVALAAMHRFMPAAWQKLTARPALLMALGTVVVVVAGFAPWLTGFSAAGETRQTYYNAVLQFLFVSGAVALLIAGGVTLHARGRALALPGARWLADHAYALYLVHWSMVHYVNQRSGFPQNLIACVALSCAVAAALRFVVEKPSIAWRDRFLAPAR